MRRTMVLLVVWAACGGDEVSGGGGDEALGGAGQPATERVEPDWFSASLELDGVDHELMEPGSSITVAASAAWDGTGRVVSGFSHLSMIALDRTAQQRMSLGLSLAIPAVPGERRTVDHMQSDQVSLNVGSPLRTCTLFQCQMEATLQLDDRDDDRASGTLTLSWEQIEPRTTGRLDLVFDASMAPPPAELRDE